MKKRNVLIVFAVLLAMLILGGCGSSSDGDNNENSNENTSVVVTLDAQGGTVIPATKEVTVGGVYGSLPDPTRFGYTFIGWFTEETAGDQVNEDTEVTNAQDHTLYARWETALSLKEVTVTFDARGGNPAPEPMTVTVGSSYGPLPVVSKTMFSFKGWYTQPAGGKKVESLTKVTNAQDHTLYAQWEPLILKKIVTVTFDAQGGTSSTSTKNVTVGNTYGELPTPTRWDHTFQGWYTQPTGGVEITAQSTVSVNTDHTLYARWHYFGLGGSIAAYTTGYEEDSKVSGGKNKTDIKVPDGTASGDLLILIFDWNDNRTPTPPKGWTTLSSGVSDKGVRHSQTIFYRKLTGSISNFSIDSPGGGTTWILLRIPEGDTPVASTVATGGSWYPDPPELTHPFAAGTDVLWIAVAGFSSHYFQNVTQWPTGYDDKKIHVDSMTSSTEQGVARCVKTAVCSLKTTTNPQNPTLYTISGPSSTDNPAWCATTIAVKRRN